MEITQLKLTKYVSVLRKYIPAGNSVDEIHQSMDGIEELCSLLRVKSSVHAPPAPVERAFEVNEPSTTSDQMKQRSSVNVSQLHQGRAPSSSLPATSNAQKTRKNYRSQLEAKRDIAEMMRHHNNTDNDFEIVVKDDAGTIETFSSYNVRLSSSSSPDCSDTDQCGTADRAGRPHRSRYEIPDDHLMSRKATKILGDRKEVEMHEFNRKLAVAADLTVDHRHRCLSRDLLNVPDVDPSGDRDSPINE